MKQRLNSLKKFLDPAHVFATLLPWLGIAFGLTLTAFLWLGYSEHIYAGLRWVSYAGITVVGLTLLIRSSRRRAFTLLALFASVAIIYLFPTLLGPGCDGMPRAFAVQCEKRWDCADDECCHGGQCLSKNDSRCGGGGPPPAQPPIISSTISCTMGSSGWCVGNSQLILGASDPQGYAVTILGNMGGVSISCNGGCTVNLPKGSGTATFTVTAAVSGLTASGSTPWKFDPDPPVPGLNLNGTIGSNGWYISSVDALASGSDGNSGLERATLTLDGGVSISSTVITQDGVHLVRQTLVDTAGNSISTDTSVKVDKTAPQINVGSASGTPGSNGWYVSEVEVSATASDATSGLALLRINVDGTWNNYAGPVVLGNGVHTVQFRAMDNAGNVTTSSLQTFRVDITAPIITPTFIGTQGDHGWYVTVVDVRTSFNDATSGVASSTMLIGGSAYSLPYTLTEDGEHDILFNVTDNAGNSASSNVIVKIDKTQPVMDVSKTGTPGDHGWYTSNIDIQVTATDAASGPQYAEYRMEDGIWHVGMTFTVSGDGAHFVETRVFDQAGNATVQSETLKIDTTAPAILLSSPAPGSVAVETVQISGQSIDLTSGVSLTQISFDTVHWLPLPVADNWLYAWDTTDLGNGKLSISARSIDQAGNIGTAAGVAVILDNHPPFLSLSDSWNIWESGTLSVESNITPLKNVRIVIHDPLQRYADRVLYSGLPAPETVKWDRVIGPASAPPGSYIVKVEVCDIYGLCSMDTGTILIPTLPTPIPFQQPVVEIPRWIPPIPFLPTLEPEPEQPISVRIVDPIPVEVQIVPSFPLWTLSFISALLLAFALLLLIDPRPSALRSLTQSFHPYIQDFKE
jgi:hypothetical protein